MKENKENGEGVPAKITASVLDAFDLLKTPKDDTKLEGGSKILSLLLTDENEKDIQYVLKRLVRSLGANVPDIRVGYYATLTAILTKLNQVTVPQLLELVKKELHANGSVKSEVGDVALGQILVCGAIFRSGLMLNCSDEVQKEVVELLISASKRKSYLSTIAHLLLLDFVNTLDEEQFATIVWANIKSDFKKDLKEYSLDSFYFLLIVSQKFGEKINLKKLFGSREIFCEENIQVICEKIMTGIDYNSVNHPVFKEIGKLMATSPHLQIFWISGIDSQLVKHNRNRELVAINILNTILDNLQDNVEIIPDLLSANFFKLFMDWFKGLQTASKIRNKRDNEDDNKIMIAKEKELLNTLCKALKSDKVVNKTRVNTLKKLLFNPGEINFTEITGTNIVKTIISDLNSDGVKKMSKLFKGVILNTSKKYIKEGVERSWYNNERLKAAELLSYLVSHESMKDDIEFKLSYMKLLMCISFFKIGGDENVAVSNDLSSSIKSCFYRCFTSRFSNVDKLLGVLTALNKFISNILEKESMCTKLEKQFSKENVECWKLLSDVCENIENSDSKSKVDKVFLILLYQLGLFLFSEPVHVKMARSSIKELKSCYEHYRKGKKKKPKKLKEGDLVDDEPEWIEVLIEVLISILSVESSILRSIVQCVFRLLWEYLTPSCIGQIISVIDPNSESNPLDNDSDSDEEVDDTENDVNGNESDKQDEGEEDDGSDSDEDDDDAEEMKTPEQLRLAIQTALGSAAPDTDTESIDADMIDEEEGRKLDEALAEAFRQFQTKSKKNKKDRKDIKALSDFRIRVLDLIDIYLEKDPSMDVCLGMIAPLTRCLELCIQNNNFAELGNRIRKTIRLLTKIRKFSSTDDVTVDILCDHLKSVIDKGLRSHFLYQALGDVVTHFGTFIIHCSQKISMNNMESPKASKSVSSLTDIFKDALRNYFQNRSCLLPIIFFHNILQIEWESNYELLPVIIENVFDNNVRQFRRNEGLELISGFYRFLKRSKLTSDKLIIKLKRFETNFANTLTSTLKSDNFQAKNNFFSLLKKLINTMKMFHESCNVESSVHLLSLLNTVGACKGSATTSSKKNINAVQIVTSDTSKKNRSKRKKNHLKRPFEPNVNGHEMSPKKIIRRNSVKYQ